MTTEQKFNAAVNVIRSLPKNGSYQPSNDLMLRFYSYFKQATLGPCTGSRPAFWDIVGRAKYDSWKSLGDMSKKDAMKKYIDELHSIVETMSYSDKVANFLEAPSNELEGLNMNDLELVVGDVLERVRSQPNSPLGSREASPTRLNSSEKSSCASSTCVELDESDEEYSDTIEAPETHSLSNEDVATITNQFYEPNINGILQKQHISRHRNNVRNVEITQEISKTVQRLKMDIENLNEKIRYLEKEKKSSMSVAKKGLFGGLSPTLLTFMILWPFLCTFIVNRMLKTKRV